MVDSQLILGNYWRSAENQRNFFIEFASQKGFDPLVSENWDKITTKAIVKQVEKKNADYARRNNLLLS